MPDSQRAGALRLGIGAVERDTGISKDTLRVWERRYGFPKPARDPFGERAYTPEDVEKLRVIRRLLDGGGRPGKLVGRPLPELLSMSSAKAPASSTSTPARVDSRELGGYLDSLKAHRVDELRSTLSRAALQAGLERFVVGLCSPLNRAVGDAWARGELEVFEEHLYTESMQVVLRNAIANIPARGDRPRVLLTTLPGESHSLGLLMAEAILALAGCRCVSLGTQTPVFDIGLAAKAQRADIVALSVSASTNPNRAAAGLSELRSTLSPETELWLGGECPAVRKRIPAGVTVVERLDGIGDALSRWRDSPAAQTNRVSTPV